MFGNVGGGGGGYDRYHNDGYDDGSPKRIMGSSYNNMYNWSNSFAPPPPPPARVNCGELRRMDIGKMVEMAGRLHKISRDRFIQIKDSIGITQLVVPTERMDLQRRFQRMPLLSFVAVMGEVHARPGRGQNEKMLTGEIEVVIEDILMVKVNKIDSKPKAIMAGMRREPPTDDNPPRITSEEYNKFHGLLPQLNNRKYTCGDLAFKLNETVNLLCWVEKSSKKFVTLVDGYGKIQCVVPSNRDEIVAIAEHLTGQAVVVITGKVTERPKSQINYTSVNGHIELQLESMDWPIFDMQNINDSDIEMKSEEEVQPLNRLTARTHTCGELRAAHVGQRVVLCGWLQFTRLAKFLLIRDIYGTTQCVTSQQGCNVDFTEVPLESVLKVEGVVAMRPPSMANEDIITGDIEVIIKELVVLSPATNPPFIPKGNVKVDEATRLQHRYMELRGRGLQNNLRLRFHMLQNMRSYLVDKFQFIEVDTPTLLAPSLAEADTLKVQTEKDGLQYNLVQYPHLHTQYLMVGEMDRFFQISKGYIGHGVEGQREVTRLQVAMSFTDRDNFLYLLEQLLHTTFPKCVATPPFTKLTYTDAMHTYGTHQPDLSYDLKFYNVTTVMDNINNDDNFGAYAIIYTKKIGKFTTQMRNQLSMLKVKYKKAHVVVNLLKDLKPLAENIVRKHIKLDHSNSFIVAYGDDEEACRSLGEVRVHLAEELSAKQLLNKSKSGVKPAWVLEAPMFPSPPEAAPHAFPAAHPDDVALTDPLKVRAMSYSLIMNGRSMGEGYLGNNDPALMEKQAQWLQLEAGVTANLLQALQSGCPPYATISLDIDSLVALACCADSIRDVIAFPKAESGLDLQAQVPEPSPALPLAGHTSDLEEPCAKIKKLE